MANAEEFAKVLEVAIQEPRPKEACKYVRVVPLEYRQLIDEKVADPKNRRWAAISRALEGQGFMVTDYTIKTHYARLHEADQ